MKLVEMKKKEGHPVSEALRDLAKIIEDEKMDVSSMLCVGVHPVEDGVGIHLCSLGREMSYLEMVGALFQASKEIGSD